MKKNSVKYMKSILSFILTVIVIVLSIYIGIKFIGFFMPFVVGWVISLIANPLVRFAENKMKIVRKHSSMFIIIGVLVLIIGGGYFAGIKITQNAGRMISEVPNMYHSMNLDFQEASKNMEGVFNGFPENVKISLDSMKDKVSEGMGQFATNLSKWTFSSAGGVAKKLPNVLISIIFTILSAYFFTADHDKIRKFGRKHIPGFIQEKWKIISDNFRVVIGGYFKAQFKIMFIVWVVLAIGFFILKIKYWILIAFLVAFLDMLPFFGTGTALIPWAVFKLMLGDTSVAIGLVILYFITQLLRRIIEPKLVGDSIGINPLVTLVFMYIGYKVGSVLGMILAVPIGAIIINFHSIGAFDNIINQCKTLIMDFYSWLKPKEN